MTDRKTIVKDAMLVITVSVVLAGLLVGLKGGITGFHSLNTFESNLTVTGQGGSAGLSFEKIPNFIANVGDEISFKVEPSRNDVIFRDDTEMFDISPDGKVEFTPTEDDVGKHNVWIIIKDAQGGYYYQNVIIIIEE
jgi:hypothetical protein